MTIEIKRNAEETIIELVGRLDTTTAPALDTAISSDIEGTKKLVIDFKSLEYISVRGFVSFSAHRRRCRRLVL